MTKTRNKPSVSRRLSTNAEKDNVFYETRMFLGKYAVAIRMLRLCRIEQKARRDDPGETTFIGGIGGTEAYWKEQLSDVRCFIESLPNESDKLFLYYHYVAGMTVEQAAEELDISRRGAFRLKKRALALATAHLPDYLMSKSARQSSSS
jgi:DNA-directed RNA polymerase specialized sigma24 family protein